MSSTWCARTHSYKFGPRGTHVDTPTNVFHVVRTWMLPKNQRNKLRATHVASRIYQHIATLAIPWRLTHLLHNRNYSKTRPLKLNSSILSFLFIQAGFMLTITFIFFSLFSIFFSSGTNYLTIDYNL